MKAIIGSLALIVVVSMDANAAQTLGSQAPRGYVPARESKASPSIVQSTDRNRDTYLQIEITISEQGHVSDVELSEGAFADPSLIKRALSASRKRKYEPATEDGKPVVSRVEVVYFKKQPFEQAFGKGFGKELDEVVASFNSGNVDKGRSIAKRMLSRTVKTRFEYVALQGAVGKGELRNANATEAIRALRAATTAAQLPWRIAAPNAYPVSGIGEMGALSNERVFLVELLEVLMRATAQQGFLAESREAYYQMAELVQIRSGDPRSDVRRTVEAALRSEEPVHARIILDEVGTWKHRLARNRFAVHQVEGSGAEVQLDCGKGLRILALPVDEMVAPEVDVNCRLRIKGAAGDIVMVSELP